MQVGQVARVPRWATHTLQWGATGSEWLLPTLYPTPHVYLAPKQRTLVACSTRRVLKALPPAPTPTTSPTHPPTTHTDQLAHMRAHALRHLVHPPAGSSLVNCARRATAACRVRGLNGSSLSSTGTAGAAGGSKRRGLFLCLSVSVGKVCTDTMGGGIGAGQHLQLQGMCMG